MSTASIAARYAKSIIEMAVEKGALENLIEDVKDFSGALKNRDLELLVRSPIIQSEKKLKIFKALFGSRYHELTNAFFGIVIRKGREPLLPEIVAEVQKQYKKLKNITTVYLTTAVKVSSETIDKIKAELKVLGEASGEIEIHTKVDPGVLGGFILEIEGRVYNASVKEKLAALKQEILDNSYIKSL